MGRIPSSLSTSKRETISITMGEEGEGGRERKKGEEKGGERERERERERGILYGLHSWTIC